MSTCESLCTTSSIKKMFCLQTLLFSKLTLIISSSCFVRVSPLQIFRGHLQNIWILRLYIFWHLRSIEKKKIKKWAHDLVRTGQHKCMLYIWLLLSMIIGAVGIHSNVNDCCRQMDLLAPAMISWHVAMLCTLVHAFYRNLHPQLRKEQNI